MTETGSGCNRRDLMRGAALFALVVGVPATIASLSDIDERERPTERQRMFAREVSQLVIPRTTTPGAGEIGVGDFLILALAHGLGGTDEPIERDALAGHAQSFRRLDGTLRFLPWLERELDRRAGGDWLRATPAIRAVHLAELDRETFPPGPPPKSPSPWQMIKGLIVTGYYTSETGAARELRYELVPGRFDPDLPLEPGARAWSSDWIAVEFG